MQSLTPAQAISARVRGSLWRLGCCLLLLLPVLARPDTALITLADQAAPTALPSRAVAAQALRIDAAGLAELTVGSRFSLAIDAADSLSMEITDRQEFLNGDRSLQARGSRGQGDARLTLTFGEQALFGYLSSKQGNRQIQARRQQGDFHGWIYRGARLKQDAAAFQQDFLIPKSRQAVIPAPRHEPRIAALKTDNRKTVTSDRVRATTGGINDGNLKLSQRFSENPVIVGDTVDVEVSIENISSEIHRNLAVEFYFVLESTELLLASPFCSEQTSLSLQQIIYCELGDLAPNARKELFFVLETSEKSRPYVSSTAIIGDLRVDDYFNVVEDVRLDSDGDGISDFNEGLLNTDPNNAASVDRQETVIDVMALYTPAAKSLLTEGVETRINQLLGVANQVYADSGVAISLRPVYYGLKDYDGSLDFDTTLNDVLNQSHPALADIEQLRATYGADLVMLFQPLDPEASRCGLATVGGYKTGGYFDTETERPFAYSLIGIDCPVDVVVAHELGHNMGLTHSHREDGTGGTFDFSTGYGVDNEFVTVMAFPNAFNTDNRVSVFSSPELDCHGYACGIEADRSFGADAVQTLNIVRHQIADYYPTVVPELPGKTVQTLSGETVNARISLAASTNQGLSHVDRVAPGQVVDVVADIVADPAHVGMRGSVNVLIDSGQGYFQLSESGAIVPWDGSVEDLQSATSIDVLRTRERLSIINDFPVSQALVGQRIAFYVAYQVSDLGDVVYTSSPLVLEVAPQ